MYKEKERERDTVRIVCPIRASIFALPECEPETTLNNLLSYSSSEHTINLIYKIIAYSLFSLRVLTSPATISAKYLLISKDRCLFYRLGLSYCIVSIATWLDVNWTRV